MKVCVIFTLVILLSTGCDGRKTRVPTVLASEAALLRRDAENVLSNATTLAAKRQARDYHHLSSVDQRKICMATALLCFGVFIASGLLALLLSQHNRGGYQARAESGSQDGNDAKVWEGRLEAGLAGEHQVPSRTPDTCLAEQATPLLSSPQSPRFKNSAGIFRLQFTPESGARATSMDSENCMTRHADSMFDLASMDSPRLNTTPRSQETNKSRRKKRVSLSNWWEAPEDSGSPVLHGDDADAYHISSADSPCGNAHATGRSRGRVSLSNWWEGSGDIESVGSAKQSSLSPDARAESSRTDTALVMRVASPTRRRSFQKQHIDVHEWREPVA